MTTFVLILPHGGKTHAPDCRWALAIKPKTPYVIVSAASVAPHVGRCSHCGGGR
jgi:hypothetical protein